MRSEAAMSMAETIHDKLVAALAPAALEVFDESHMHAAGKSAQSHFKVVVVSDRFDALPLVRRHRLVHEVLAEELAGKIHALSVHAYTPAQWTARGEAIPTSPPCRGGGKRRA
jgi:BolA family transcriptional regulator, general stress-responsive regulator